LLIVGGEAELLAHNAHGGWLKRDAVFSLHEVDKLLERGVRMGLKM
jgi:hypothetical protein